MKNIHALMNRRLYNPNLGILFLRTALGGVFIHAGWVHLVAAGINIVAGVEFIVGVALFVGIFTRYVAIIGAGIMLVALFNVHVANGFWLHNGGIEHIVVLLMGLLAMIAFGPGLYSLVHAFDKKA